MLKNILRIKVLSVSLIIVAFFILTGTKTVEAASLTSAQIQAIVNLLQSFGADQNVINNVNSVLNGTVISPVQPERICYIFLNNLKWGSRDSGTNGEVSKLQQFLNSEGYSVSTTGYFGTDTYNTLVKWQKANNVDSTGYFGDITRARVKVRCLPSVPSVTILSPNGGEIYKNDGSPITVNWQTNNVPSTFTFDVIRLRGYPNGGEYNLSYNTPNDGQEVVYPSHVPVGAYTLEIKSYLGDSLLFDSSDSYFKIASSVSGNLPPVIGGITAPTVLRVGETGAWTIRGSYDPENGPLTYTVSWGDENMLLSANSASAGKIEATSPTQTTSFTHVYARSGVYNPTFTVTDNGGLSAKTSATVKVGEVVGLGTAKITVLDGSIVCITTPCEFPIKNAKVSLYQMTNGQTIFIGSNDTSNGAAVFYNLSVGEYVAYATASGFQEGKVVFKTVSNDAVSTSIRLERAIIQPSITVLSPNGGETWQKGTQQTIKWQDTTTIPTCPPGAYCAQYMSALRLYDIKLAPYYPPCTSNVCPAYAYHEPYTIAKGISGSSYGWTVGGIVLADDLLSLAPDGSYTIQVCQTGTSICDSSNSYFKIVSTTAGNHSPEIVTGSSYAGTIIPGQAVNFGWTAKDADNDDLSWSVDWGDNSGGTSSCSSVRRQTATGWAYNTSHTWAQTGTYQVKVTVSDCFGGTVSNSFTVMVGNSSQPSITVLSPNGGETYVVGQTVSVTWSSNNAGPEVDLRLDKDGVNVAGVDNIQNNGSYPYQLFLPNSYVGTGFKIRISGQNGYGGSDSSDSTFNVNLLSTLSDSQILTNLETAVRNHTYSLISPSSVKDQNFDFNSDGKSDATDQIMIRNVLTASDTDYIKVYNKITTAVQARYSTSAGSTAYITEFDVTQDGRIDSSDLARIQQVITGSRVVTSAASSTANQMASVLKAVQNLISAFSQ